MKRFYITTFSLFLFLYVFIEFMPTQKYDPEVALAQVVELTSTPVTTPVPATSAIIEVTVTPTPSATPRPTLPPPPAPDNCALIPVNNNLAINVRQLPSLDADIVTILDFKWHT